MFPNDHYIKLLAVCLYLRIKQLSIMSRSELLVICCNIHSKPHEYWLQSVIQLTVKSMMTMHFQLKYNMYMQCTTNASFCESSALTVMDDTRSCSVLGCQEIFPPI